MARIDERLLDVNAHGVLRIPAEIWLALVFLARHWVLTLVVTVIARRSKEAYILFGADFSWVVLAIEVPALLMVALCLRRLPEAGALVRRLWPLARHLGAATAVMHLVYVAWYLWNSSYWLPWPELFLASCALIDFVIIVSLYRSSHLQRVFAEFPAPRTESKPSTHTAT
jgi:hypothetical protein